MKRLTNGMKTLMNITNYRSKSNNPNSSTIGGVGGASNNPAATTYNQG